jgi:hypothetical protein
MKKKIGLALLVLVGLTAFTLFRCGKKTETRTVEAPPQQSCDGVVIGSIVKDECKEGYEGEKIKFCTPTGWQITDLCLEKEPTCDDDLKNKVTFDDDLKPLIENSCALSGCHTDGAFVKYDVVKQTIDKMIYRINLGTGDVSRMPKPPAPELKREEKEIFEKWKSDGLHKTRACDEVGPDDQAFIHLDLNYIEQNTAKYLQNIGPLKSAGTRFLVLSNQYNLNPTNDDYRQFIVGMNKAINLLNEEEEYIYPLTPIDEKKTIYALDLETFGITTNQWDHAVVVDPFRIISQTATGKFIIQQTRSAEPWMHAENFVNLAFSNSDLYYDIINAPKTFDGLLVQQQIDYHVNLNVDFKALLIGFFGSEISNNKNRLISRYDSKHGACWITYDPLRQDDQSNLFQNFLLLDSRIFKSDGSEIICDAENGGHTYYLFNAAGQRIGEAPVDLVRDTQSPFSPIISNAISCTRCHAGGYIKAKDSVRDHLTNNGSQFNIDETQKGLELYKGNVAANAAFVNDNRGFNKFMLAFGGNVLDKDPLNFLTDHHRKDHDIKEVAAFVFLTVQEFTVCLQSSADLRAQIGQLLTGGSISRAQLIDSFPVLKRDCRIGLEPLGQ